MNEQVKRILAELREQLAVLYGERLRDVYLYGSYARDEAGEESDMDVMIVLNRVDDYAAEINRTGQVISGLSLEAETLLRAGQAEFAAGRAYYAMLHVAQALLGQKGLHYRKHSGVHAAFGEHFARTSVWKAHRAGAWVSPESV